MNIKRLFSTEGVKGTQNYINSQKKYEIIRTVIYFGISLSLFAAGFLTTGSRNNLLTIVAVLGCLPASKSLVSAVMYCKYKSLGEETAAVIVPHEKDVACLYDLIFTTREKTYPVLHAAVRGNTVIGFMPSEKLSDTDCSNHLLTALKVDNFTSVSVKIFKDVKKYAERLDQISQLQEDAKLTTGIVNTLKSIAL